MKAQLKNMVYSIIIKYNSNNINNKNNKVLLPPWLPTFVHLA